MAIYYKFKSARDYDTVAMDGPFISVGILKDKIFETKHLGTGKDLDIVVSNAQTNEGLYSLSYSVFYYVNLLVFLIYISDSDIVCYVNFGLVSCQILLWVVTKSSVLL